MTEMSDRMANEADPATTDEKPASHPLAHLFATVERSVNEIRASELSPYDLRQQARARDRGQSEVWASIRSP
ncbi:MAG: hypothetical protein ACLP22_25505, partial [Solirubrobacteraceae bacterium]